MKYSIGSYLGFTLTARYDYFFHLTYLHIKGALNHEVEFGTDSLGNITRINHVLESMANKLAAAEQKLENTRKQLATAKEEVTKPFAQEDELAQKLNRLSELNTLLDLDETGENTLDMEEQEDTKENSSKRLLSR